MHRNKTINDPTFAGRSPLDDTGNQYIIERTIPGADRLTAAELKSISQKSRMILEALGPQIQWQQSYVAEGKFYCVYEAPNKDIIVKHAELGGFPADRIVQVCRMIGPQTAEDS
ncbi:DUF4242 domain-containing protein [Microbulbifer agarilyticus]|uniref:DUF4242 domain-containing protein n=1 Tax=Microbulbifer agarilyticus TaxID=260552 RepID=UPI001C975325|nr:DUF4242 domain-containing protein [Microbulbifer agarilyticus]MBY6189244.1 DUF4242 domain-containing protein [Microbulbifer agarilyticus]